MHETACAEGDALAGVASREGLVADCGALLEARDSLRGTSELNWSAARPIEQWTGVVLGHVDGVRRVTELNLDRRGLNGSIPTALGRLDGLQRLQLAGRNRLTAAIPAELGRLTRLTYLNLSGNRLGGAIPPELGRLTRLTYLNLSSNRLTGRIPAELGQIGPQLVSLILSGPEPLPAGVGLSGPIPAQLANLSGLVSLYLAGNRLSGSIPPQLGRLASLRWMYLDDNRLTGPIPTQLGGLGELRVLQVRRNRLTGPVPSQLGGLARLGKLYLYGNSGLSGCLPTQLSRVRFTDLRLLGLPDCPAGSPPTPETPLPTYTLQVSANEGGTVAPAGATSYSEPTTVVIEASWNDATHSFSGWSGDCVGTTSSCELLVDGDLAVTATFAALPADRCATPTASNCIRAVYRGAPDDYRQVADIPPRRR